MDPRICKECHCAVMKPHHELIFWFKCPTCGFTELNLEWLSLRNRAAAKRNKFAKIDEFDERIWKPRLDDED